MTSESGSARAMWLPPGFLGMPARPPCKMSSHPEPAVLQTPQCGGAPVDSPS